MRKSKWFAGIATLIISLVMFGAVTIASNGQDQLAKVRQATVQYHNVETAFDNGYVPVGPAFEVPGYGTMGYHYLNFAELMDPSINPDRPEVLLYTRTKDQKDGVRLVGVEYVVASEAWTLDGKTFYPGWSGDTPPSIFSQTFEGVMDGHGPGEPKHYDKHVWLWQANPNGVNEPIWPKSPGIFSQFNPNVQCDSCTPADDPDPHEEHSH